MTASNYQIRPMETIEEYRACVELQEETWGRGFSERVAPAILKVSQLLGGVSAGAFDNDGRLIGFVFGMTGLRGGELVHWSDMLAVRPEIRDSGLGTALKAYQRRRMKAIGVKKMHWTFDPLQSRNAYLNFTKLGIVVREYARDMYGQTDSPLHMGIGTDRFIALWLMETERVERRLAGRDPTDESSLERADAVRVLGAKEGRGHPEPGKPDLSVDADALLVAIPGELGAIMKISSGLAMQWRLATREVLTRYMSDGWEVRECLRRGATSDYLLLRGAE